MKLCLYIDANPASRVIMGLFLKDLGYKLVFATEGFEAITKLQNQNFDLVVVDAQIPKLSGNAVASYIRAHPRHRDTMVISITATADSEYLARTVNAGADIALTKPIDYDYLIGTVDHLTKQRTGEVRS